MGAALELVLGCVFWAERHARAHEMVLILFVFIFGIYLDGRKIANNICDLFGWRAKRKYVFAIYLHCAKNANNIRNLFGWRKKGK